MTRDINSVHWVLQRRTKCSHIRFSTILYTDAANEYEPVHDGKITAQTSFLSLSLDKHKQLYRAYLKLVCYVPWTGSAKESFLNESQRSVSLRFTTYNEPLNNTLSTSLYIIEIVVHLLQ